MEKSFNWNEMNWIGFDEVVWNVICNVPGKNE